MYTVNGVALDNKAQGWRLLRASMPLPEFGNRLVQIERGGRDGVTPFASTRDVITMMFKVESTFEGLPALLALFSRPTISVRHTDRPGVEAIGRVSATTPETFNPAPNRHQYSFLIEIPGASWRDVAVTTTTLAGFNNNNYQIFPNMSAPVQDAIVRFRGPVTNPQITDVATGAFVSVSGTIAANQFLRFHATNGRAWLTTTDTWTGGTEASGEIDYGGPRGVFELTPNFTTNPSVRSGSYSLTSTSSAAGSGVQIRGYNAYIF